MAASPKELDDETQALQSLGRGEKRRRRVPVELDHFGDKQHLAGDAAIGVAPLQPLINQPLMGGVLVDDDERIAGLGDDEGILHLGACGAEGVVAVRRIAGGAPPHIGARLGQGVKWRLATIRHTEDARAGAALIVLET